MSDKISTLAEELAEYACDNGYDSSISAVRGFAEQLFDTYYEGITAELKQAEAEVTLTDIIDIVDELVPEADKFIAAWNRDAQEEHEEREEARRGQY